MPIPYKMELKPSYSKIHFMKVSVVYETQADFALNGTWKKTERCVGERPLKICLKVSLYLNEMLNYFIKLSMPVNNLHLQVQIMWDKKEYIFYNILLCFANICIA